MLTCITYMPFNCSCHYELEGGEKKIQGTRGEVQQPLFNEEPFLPSFQAAQYTQVFKQLLIIVNCKNMAKCLENGIAFTLKSLVTNF